MEIPGLRGLSFGTFLKRLFRAAQEDLLLDNAAQLAFFFLFSLFPLLFFLVTLTAYLPLEGAVDTLMQRAAFVMPAPALDIIRQQLNSLLERPRPKLLTLSLAVALWSASRGTDAFRKALNLAYEVTESRSFVKVQGLAIATTAVSALVVPVAFAGMILGGDVGLWLANKAHVGSAFQMVWSWLRWPFTAALIMLVAALSYYLLPDVKQRFRYITPGSLTATLLWLLATWGFTKYVDSFGSFDVTYGSLGGAIALTAWLYLSGVVFMLGGEINAVVEHALPDGKQPGARDFGQAPTDKSAKPGPSKSRAAARRARLSFRRERAPAEEPAEPPEA